MIYDDLVVALRERVGRPSIDEVNDRRLLSFLNSALEWLAAEFQYNSTVATLGIDENDYEHPLGVGVAEVLWVKHGTKTLEPASIALWVRDGIDWRNSTAGQPEQYAFEAGTLWLYPQPDATAADTDLTYGYLPAAPEIDTDTSQSPGNTTATPLLSSANQGLLVWKAAEEYFSATITPENMGQRNLQIQACVKQVADRLGNARRQVKHGARSSGPRPSVFSRHGGAAR